MGLEAAVVELVGTGPAAEAIEGAVKDTDAVTRPVAVDETTDEGTVCVVDRVGSATFGRINEDRNTPWIAVELGGLGGVPIQAVSAGVSVFGGEAGCFRCLQSRVRANLDTEPAEQLGVSRSHARLAGAHAGRLLVDLVDGNEVSGRVIELPYAEHELLPVPTCSCSPAPDHDLELRAESIELAAAVDRAERTIDGRIGLINTIGEANSFPAPYYLASLANTTGFSDARAGPQAAGVADDWNEAFMKAAGEALERYAAGVYRTASFRTTSATAIDDPIPPDAFVRPDDYPTPSEEEPLDWLPGITLATETPVWLPAEYVVYPPPEERHKPAITTGLGLGTSVGGAVLSGLYEVVERDATMLAWYSTFEPLGLEVTDERFETLVRRARAEELTVTPLLVTQDIDVPVVSVAVHRENAWPQFAIGSGADLDPAGAAVSALAEALQNWMELRGMGPEGAEAEETSIGRYSHFPREVQALVDPDGWVAADELAPAKPLSGMAELDRVRAALESVELDVYLTRLTTIDLEEVGFEAVRVLAPTAQPLFIDERCFGSRAREVPRTLGYRPRFDRPPHPYP